MGEERVEMVVGGWEGWFGAGGGVWGGEGGVVVARSTGDQASQRVITLKVSDAQPTRGLRSGRVRMALKVIRQGS